MAQQARSNSMSSEDQATSNATDALLAEYLRRVEAGESVDRQEFLKQCPAAAEALRSYFEGADLVERFAADKSFVRRATAAWQEPPSDQSFRNAETIAPNSMTDSTPIFGGPLAKLPAQFGRFRVERLLGSGAMGAVYWAWDIQLDRPVALKVPKITKGEDSDVVNRLLREAKAAASLSHPHICRVYDAGVEAGTYFIAMEFIDGRPLSEHITPDTFQDERRCVIMVRKIASALIDAHAKGITHRDLKPGNILINERGEPILTDFGLARRDDSYHDVRVTQTGMMIGSPAYMSPEQVDGETDRVGPWSDIYSLGVVLFELLTGQLPFRGSVVAILSQVVLKEPPLPSSLRPGLDPRLDAICQRMMAKRPEDRFASMTEVQQELTSWLKSAPRDTPLSSPNTNPARETIGGLQPMPEKRVAENTVTAKKADAVANDVARQEQQARKLLTDQDYDAAIPLLTKLAELDAMRFKDAVAWAKTELPAAKQKQQKLRERIAAACEKSRALLTSFAYLDAVQLLEAIPEPGRTAEHRQLLAEANERADDCTGLKQEIDDSVKRKKYDRLLPLVKRYLKLKPDNPKMQRLAEHLIRNRPDRAVANYKETRRFFEVAGRLVEPKELALSVIGILALFLAVSYSVRSYLANRAPANNVAIIAPNPPPPIRGPANENPTTSAMPTKAETTSNEISADSATSVTTPQQTDPTVKQTSSISAQSPSASEPTVIPDSPLVSSPKKQFRTWSVAFSPNRRFVVTGVTNGTACLWDTNTGELLGKTMQHESVISSVAFSPDSASIVTGIFVANNSRVKFQVWDVATTTTKHVPFETEGTACLVWFSSNGQRVFFVAGIQQGFRWWEPERRNSNIIVYPRLQEGVWTPPFALSLDGRTLLLGSAPTEGRNAPSRARLWDYSAGRLIGGVMQPGAPITATEFSPDGKLLLMACVDHKVHLWDARTTKLRRTFQAMGTVTAATLSPDSMTVFTVSDRRTIEIWDLRDARLATRRGSPIVIPDEVKGLAFKADGQNVLVVRADGEFQTIDAFNTSSNE